MNNTKDDVYLWKLNNDLAFELAPNTAIFVLYAIIGITGNAISIYIYCFRMKNIRGKRHFILCLSVTDLVSCAIASGFSISLDVLPLLFKGEMICKLMWTLNSFLTISSALLLLLIAVHRYRLICVPLGKPFTIFWRRLAIVVTFLTAIILSIPNLAFYGETTAKYHEYNISGTTCGTSHDQQHSEFLLIYNCILLVTFAIGATALMVLYWFIGRTILSLSSNNKSRERNEMCKHANSFMEKSTTSIGPSSKQKDLSDFTKRNHTKFDDINTDTLPKFDKKRQQISDVTFP